MAHLSEKLAELRRRISDSAHEEQTLIRTLNTALNHVDEELLTEIRHVTAQHEARRAMILNELQILASRVCALPLPQPEQPPAIEDENHSVTAENGKPVHGTHAPGNWRIAARNVEDDLDFFDDDPQSIRLAQ